MKYCFLFVSFIFLQNLFCQNPWISNNPFNRVKFRIDNIYLYYTGDYCTPHHNDQVGDLEFKWNVYVSDSPNQDGNGWTNDGSCLATDISSSSYPGSPLSRTNLNHVFYDRDCFSSTSSNISFRFKYENWESDGCGATCEYNTGCQSLTCWTCPSDQCFIDVDIDSYDYFPASTAYYNLEWHFFKRIEAIQSNPYYKIYVDIDLWYDIDTYYGSNYTTAFNFGTIDNTTCPDVYHYFNNSSLNYCNNNANRGPYVYYKFVLNNTRNLIFDISEQPDNPSNDLFQGMQLINSSFSSISSTSSTSLSYNNLAPGTYYVKLTSNAANRGRFKFKINTNTSSPYVWTGYSNQSWNNANNWSTCLVPTLSTAVEIPFTSNQPIISNGQTGQCKSISIETNNNAKLTIESGGVLQTNN